MGYDAIVHQAVWAEIPADEHSDCRAVMREVAAQAEPSRHPAVKRVRGAMYEPTYRVRAGRWRILFLLLPDARALVFTTAFLKRRDADYGPALQRHDQRVRAYE